MHALILFYIPGHQRVHGQGTFGENCGELRRQRPSLVQSLSDLGRHQRRHQHHLPCAESVKQILSKILHLFLPRLNDLDQPGYSFTIPKNLPSGDYLVRIEQAALHAASTFGGGTNHSISFVFYSLDNNAFLSPMVHQLCPNHCHWWRERHPRSPRFDPRSLHWKRTCIDAV